MSQRETQVRRSDGRDPMEDHQALNQPICGDCAAGLSGEREGPCGAPDCAGYVSWQATAQTLADQLEGAVELLEQARDFLAQAYSDDEDNDSPGNMAYALLSGAINRLGGQ